MISHKSSAACARGDAVERALSVYMRTIQLIREFSGGGWPLGVIDMR
jgi:hypothetical protein